MTTHTLFLVLLAAVLLLPLPGRGEDITVASWNIENWNTHFEAHRASTRPIAENPEVKDILTDLRKANDEDNWEAAQVMLDPKFAPDIIVMEEACDQDDLRYFNHRWLSDAYDTAIQFPTNTDRHQNLDLLAKKGFKILERRDRYYLEPDPVGNDRGGRLFARGPAFVKVKSPGGFVFWIGVTHMKSKNVGTSTSANLPGDTKQKSIEATKWRNREAARTHEIMKELQSAGPKEVILLGDMNDSVGLDQYEPQAGGDAIMNLVGPAADGFTLATQPLVDAKQFSFNGYWRTDHRELIDHAVVSSAMKPHVKNVQLFQDGWTPVASDHFPLMVKLSSE